MGKLTKFNNIIFSFILYILVIVVARILFICFFSNLYFIKEKVSKIFDESDWSSDILAFTHTMFYMYSWDGICFLYWPQPSSTLSSGHKMNEISELCRYTQFFLFYRSGLLIVLVPPDVIFIFIKIIYIVEKWHILFPFT